MPLRCLEVAFLKSLCQDNSSDIYFCLFSFCGSLAVKESILRCRDKTKHVMCAMGPVVTKGTLHQGLKVKKLNNFSNFKSVVNELCMISF